MKKYIISIIQFLLLLFACTNLSLAALKPVDQALIDSLHKKIETRPAEVEKIIDSLISVSITQRDSFKNAKLLDVKGQAKRELGKYAEAIKSYHQAYDLYNLIRSKSGAVGSLNGLGLILLRTGQYEEAEKYFHDALNIVDKNDTVMLKVLFTNLGVAYDYSDESLQAIETYKKASNYIAKDDDYSKGVIQHNIGVCYNMLKEYKKAEEYELSALNYQEKNSSLDLLARIGISLGGLYLDIGNINKASYYLKLGGDAALKTNSIELEEEYYEHLINLYVNKKDTKKALEYFDKLNALKAKIYSKENSKNIAEAETKFNIAIKNKEIENLRISKNLMDLKMDRDRMIRNVILLILFLSLIFLFIVYHNYHLRKKNLLLLARENQLIENEKKALEKNNEYLQSENILARFEILKSQVSPHFLFNTLNALSYLIESDPEKAVDFTNAFSKLYRTVLELKDQHLVTLEQELSHVEDYFFLQKTRFGEHLKIDKNISPTFLDRKLPPFSIQIAVENAINHNIVSGTKPLQIKIVSFGNYLVIENNLQVRTNKFKSTSMGISNIKARYSYFTDTNPEFTKTETSFIVKLPLLQDQ